MFGMAKPPPQPSGPTPPDKPHEYRDALPDGPLRGRGSTLNPGNRFESLRLHVLGEHLDHVRDPGEGEAPSSSAQAGTQVPTQVIPDQTRSILNRVDSPDIPFNWSLNPYRGCEHGCVYCYARPTHEYLGMNLGVDFETRILVKHQAPALLRRELAKPAWKAEVISMAGNTDCYQPLERELRITRGCLEVMAQCRQPVGIVTKNKLVLRDLDLLRELAAHDAVVVAVSVTTLDPQLAAKMEPRASAPRDRLQAITALREAGVPVAAMIAPIIPALNDREVPALLDAVAQAGAQWAGYVLLRLPWQIKELFSHWLTTHFPERAAHVLSLIRDTRGGELYDARFGARMRGEGAFAQQIARLFKVHAARRGLDRSRWTLSGAHFRKPQDPPSPQLSLFE